MPMTNRTLSHLIREEAGEDLIEYAMAAGLVGAGAVVALKGTSGNLSDAFSSLVRGIVNRF